MTEPAKPPGDDSSVLGRLLREVSWTGSAVRNCRDGGRGYENVLTAEVLLGLDFLPRRAFLGAVIDAARGADDARARFVSEIEDARITVLPDVQYLVQSGGQLQTELSVYPDALIESPNVYAVVEAKRPHGARSRRSSWRASTSWRCATPLSARLCSC